MSNPSQHPKTPLSLRQDLLRLPAGSSVLALAVLNAAVSSTHAAPPATPAPEPVPRREATANPTQLPEVLVQGVSESYKPERATNPKYPEPLLDTPQSISIVPQAVIRDQNATNLRDIVRNVPGVTIQAGEGGAAPGDNFIIRGFSGRTDLYVDGVRDLNGFSRDPFNIEQVEITKGPSSVYTGRGTTGGSINVVTKKPVATAFYGATAGIGTDDYYRGTIDINQPIRFGWGGSASREVAGKDDGKGGELFVPATDDPTTAFRINAVWHNSDYPGRDEASYSRWGVAPSIAFGLGGPTQLTVSYMHLDQDNMPDFGLPWVTATNIPLASSRNQPAPVSFANYYGLNQRDREYLRTDELTALLTHTLSDDANIRFTSHYGRNYRDSVISAPRFISDAVTDINREFQSRDEIDTIMTQELDFTWKVATFGFEHTIITGLEWTRETFQNRLRTNTETPLADLYNPDVNDRYPGKVRRSGAVNEADTDTLAAYLFDTIKFGKHWELSGGARFDYFNADYEMHPVTGNNVDFNRADKLVSWRGALLYKPVEIGSIYFGAGSSYNPSAEGLALTDATQHLRPERTTTYELGTKWDLLDRRLALNAAVFYTLKQDARTPGLTPADPVTVLEGEQQALGFEIEAKGHLTKDWEVIGGYTYVDTQIKKSNNPAEVGNELPGVPRNAFTLWTTYDLPYGFQIGAGAQYIDQRFANLINTRNGGSYCTFDAMLAYKVNKNLTLRANVYNLTDEEYIGGLHTQGSFGHFIPGAGRSATLTASVLF